MQTRQARSSASPPRRRSAAAAVVTALLAAFGPIAGPAPARADRSPAQFIEALGEQAISELAPDSIAGAERERRFRGLLRANFDLPRISRFVLGRYARNATPEQLSEFERLYEELMVLTYSRLFASYAGETFRVTREIGSPGARYTMVVTEVRLPAEGETIELQWQVINEAGGHAVVDIRVEGVSMAIAQREEFGAVLQKNDGDVSALIEQVREQVARLRRNAKS